MGCFGFSLPESNFIGNFPSPFNVTGDWLRLVLVDEIKSTWCMMQHSRSTGFTPLSARVTLASLMDDFSKLCISHQPNTTVSWNMIPVEKGNLQSRPSQQHLGWVPKAWLMGNCLPLKLCSRLQPWHWVFGTHFKETSMALEGPSETSTEWKYSFNHLILRHLLGYFDSLPQGKCSPHHDVWGQDGSKSQVSWVLLKVKLSSELLPSVIFPALVSRPDYTQHNIRVMWAKSDEFCSLSSSLWMPK